MVTVEPSARHFAERRVLGGERDVVAVRDVHDATRGAEVVGDHAVRGAAAYDVVRTWGLEP